VSGGRGEVWRESVFERILHHPVLRWKVEETCYNDIWKPVSCQRYDNDEPCPLPTTASLNNRIGSQMLRVNNSNGEEEKEGNVFRWKSQSLYETMEQAM